MRTVHEENGELYIYATNGNTKFKLPKTKRNRALLESMGKVMDDTWDHARSQYDLHEKLLKQEIARHKNEVIYLKGFIKDLMLNDSYKPFTENDILFDSTY